MAGKGHGSGAHVTCAGQAETLLVTHKHGDACSPLTRACVHQVYRHHVADMLLLLGALVTFAATESLNPRLTYIPVDSLYRYSYPVKVSMMAGRWCHIPAWHAIPPH